MRKGYQSLLLATLLLICPLLSYGFIQSLTYGPTDVVKRQERAIYGSDTGDAILIDIVDKSCGSVDGFSATSYYLGPRVNAKATSWSFNGPCFSITPTFVTSTYIGGSFPSVIMAIKSTNKTEVYTVNQNGFTKNGEVEDGFSLTNFGLFVRNNEIFYYNEGVIKNLSQNFSYTTPVSSLLKKVIVNEAGDIYAVASVSGNHILAKIDFNSSNYTSYVQLNSTIGSSVLLGSNGKLNDPGYIQRNGLMFCGDRIMVGLVTSNLLNIAIAGYDSSFNLVYYSQKSLASDEQILNFACDPVTKEVFLLRNKAEILITSDVIYYFDIDRYDGTGKFISDYSLLTNQTSLSQTPAYTGVVTTPRGTTYAHRQGRQELGTNTEVYGVVYSRCNSQQFGKDCSPCTCQQGTCDWGEYGSGKCTSCSTNRIAGDNCQLNCYCLFDTTPCNHGINGDARCFCDLSAAIGFNCSSCENGYFLDDSKVCSLCPVRFYCVNSERRPCPNNDVPGLSYCKESPTSITPTSAPTSAPTTTETPGDNTKPPNYIPIIIGAVLGGLVLLIIIICIIVYCCYVKRKRAPKAQYVPNNQTNELTVL